MKILGKNQKVKRIFNDIIVIGLLIQNSVNNITHSNKIDLFRTTYNDNTKVTLVTGFNILEINICELLDEIKRKKDVKLFDKYIARNGVDWLKLIGLRFWAKKKYGSLGQYIFPRIKKDELYSQNPFINEVILELIDVSNFDINCFSQLEDEFANNYNKAFDKATKKAQLDSLYTLLLRGANNLLNDFRTDYKYTEKEVMEIIFKKIQLD